MADVKELTEKENEFIDNLLRNGGRLGEAAEKAGFAKNYAYALRKRLNKHIIDAAQEYLALHAVNAASRVVASVDGQLPNAVNLTAALAVLDRVGVVKRDGSIEGQAVKANVFILPVKDDEKE